tara:strand:- start:261 stop:1160 length:900 start_codon:yes stop_codon:yes gene_type:complete
MATVFYDKAAVELTYGSITQKLLATDCSLSFSNSMQPLYSIGTKGALGQFPAAARQGDLSFNFLTTITGTEGGGKIGTTPLAGNIVNYLASGIKNSTNSHASGVQIKFAGVSGSGFLNSYGFNVGSNTISTSSAGFTFFGSGAQEAPVSGFLHEFAGNTAQTGILATGVAHGRYTNLDTFRTSISNSDLGPTAADNGTVFSADYSISFNHVPVYKVGQEFPTTTFYTTAQESLGITEDVFNSGLAFDQAGQNLTMQVKGLSTTAQAMEVGLSGATQVSTAMSAGMDDIVRTQKNLTSVY